MRKLYLTSIVLLALCVIAAPKATAQSYYVSNMYPTTLPSNTSILGVDDAQNIYSVGNTGAGVAQQTSFSGLAYTSTNTIFSPLGPGIPVGLVLSSYTVDAQGNLYYGGSQNGAAPLVGVFGKLYSSNNWNYGLQSTISSGENSEIITVAVSRDGQTAYAYDASGIWQFAPNGQSGWSKSLYVGSNFIGTKRVEEMTVAPNGALYVLSYDTAGSNPPQLALETPSGSETQTIIPMWGVTTPNYLSMVADSNGNLFLADPTHLDILEFSRSADGACRCRSASSFCRIGRPTRGSCRRRGPPIASGS